MTVYRGMDQEELDRAYDNRAAVPAYSGYLENWVARSVAYRATRPERLDMRYGERERNRLDYFAAAAANAPTLLFIHGGYWQWQAKENFAFLAEGVVPNGISLALCGYTLGPEATMSEIVAEVRAAVRWLHAHLEELGGDPERLFVSGWSAGGHLTASVVGESCVKGGLAISGLYDLEPIRLSYLNAALRMDEAMARAESPIHHLPDQSGQLMVVVGDGELPELRRQSREYYEAWRSAGLPGSFEELPSHDHFSILEELSKPDGRFEPIMRRLID